MTLKYDFNITTTNNVFIDALVYGNDNTHNLLVYTIVLFLFSVLTYVYLKRTNDIRLSFLYGLFASTLISTIFYYMGVFINNTYSTNISLFSGSILLSMVIINIIGFAIFKFNRNELNQ